MYAMTTIPDPLSPLAIYQQFILYRVVPSQSRPGKADKLPVNPDTMIVSNAHNIAIWKTYDEVAAIAQVLGDDYGVGFVFTADDPFFFIDIDNCLIDGRWSDTANILMGMLPGSAVEISQSGQGLHIIGKCTKPISHSCKNTPLGLEMYTSDRFVALTGSGAVGDAATDCTVMLPRVIENYFPPVVAGTPEDWRDEPVPEWAGPEGDDDLIQRMIGSRSAKAQFGTGASFADLWNENIPVLTKAYPSLNAVDSYDRSSADAALAQHLAFWTGKNHARMLRLMKMSGLVRTKWVKHGKYLGMTISNAVNKQLNVYRANTESSYSEIMSELDRMSDKLSTEQTTRICKLTANTDLTVPEKAEIVEQLKKRSSLGSKRVIEKAISEQHYEKMIGVNHPQLAQIVISNLGKADVIYSTSYFWIWKGGVWVKSDDMRIRQAVQTVCQDKLIGEYTKATVDSVFGITTTELFIPDHKFNDIKDINIINVLNGELHYIENGWVLWSHEREHYFTTQLPVTYDPKATAPRFVQFLNEIFDGDPDAMNKAQVLLEMIGYSMLPTCRFERFIMLMGNGANGKSVLLAIVEALIGKTNVCAVQPSQFENKFQRAHLHGKLANIITEIAEGAKLSDAELKAIVSGELTTAEHKNKPPFDFRPMATCWFGTNHIPHTRDVSDAIFRRAVILEFNNRFVGDRCDPNLIDKLTLELPGILNMALSAISSVLERGSISTCHSSEEAKRKWRQEADQVAQFVDERCVDGFGYKVDTSVLYRAYEIWASSSGIKRMLNKNNFGKRIERLGYSSAKGVNLPVLVPT